MSEPADPSPEKAPVRLRSLWADTAVRQTLVLILLVCLTISSLTAWQIRSEYESQLQQHRKDVTNLSTILLRNAEAALLQSTTILLGLEERLQHGSLSAGEQQRLQTLIRDQARSYPEIHGAFVFDASGLQTFSSLEHTAGGNFAERDYFQYHRDNPDPALHIAPPIRSRTTGEEIITVSQRLNDARGQFNGLVLVTLRVQAFLRVYRTLHLGTNPLVCLIHKDGWLLIRQPAQDRYAGKNISTAPTAVAYDEVRQGMQSGSAIYTTPMDGVRRIVGFSASQTLPIYLIVGLDEAEAFREWRQTALTSLAVALGPLLLIILLGWKTIASIYQRHQAEDSLRQAHQRLMEMNHSLEILAAQDALTGLANRRQLDRVLQHYFQQAVLLQTPLSFILMDIDDFKAYNDTYGHPAGDQALRQISQKIRGCLHRHADIPARYGGEELAVILPATSLQGALKVAENIRQAVLGLNLENRQTPSGLLTLSLGVACCTPGLADSPQRLVAQADAALYQAKAAGKNQVMSPPDTQPEPPATR